MTDAPLIPAAYIARWLALLETRGISAERALAGTPVAPDAIADPNTRLAVDVVADILACGVELAGDPSLPLELGLSLKLIAHSWYGLALMSAATLRDACELATRYMTLRLSPWRCH